MKEAFSAVLNALEGSPLTFEPAYAEQDGLGQKILAFTCRELPGSEFLYVPGRRGVTLGWDTSRCPLPPEVLEEFHQYYLDGLDKLDDGAGGWEDYLQKLLADLDACTSPLRTADIPPMLVERRAWNEGSAIEPPFALPTEDEWEYLCCGGVHSLFPWGDELDLYEIDYEELDKDAKNAFGLVIGNDCRAEQVADTNFLKGDDGGCALCGGEGDRASFGYVPYFRYDLYYPDLPPSSYPLHRRRVLRLAPPGEDLCAGKRPDNEQRERG